MVSRKIVLKFPATLVDRPVVCNLARRFDLEFSILRASVTPSEEGLLVLELRGSENACREGVTYLEELGIDTRNLSQDITRNETRCTSCGACVGVCPSGALALERATMEVIFRNEKCVACEMCIRACPVRAMQLQF